MTTSNIFDVMVCEGPKASFRWDALWRTWKWFCSVDDGHGMGAAFADQLANYASLDPSGTAGAKVEYKITSNAGSQWVDLAVGFPDLRSPIGLVLFEDIASTRLTDARKRRNLTAYMEWANRHASNIGRCSLMVVTNSPSPSVSASVEQYLGPCNPTLQMTARWRCLPVSETGRWVDQATAICPPSPILSDYVKWATAY